METGENRERKTVIEMIGLTKIFRDFWHREKVRAVDNLTLNIYQGEVFGLLGPNGSGKTTTINLILGLLYPSRGRVRVFGRNPRNIDIKERIGYQPEESYLYRYLNAEESLDFFGRLFKLPPGERTRRIDALLEMVGLSKVRHRPLNEYSKGMSRRITLAQALINDPELIIMDEPTTGMDPLGRKQIKDLILELKKRGKTVLLSSHLLADVEDVCDRIGILYGGKIRAVGPVDELLADKSTMEILTPPLRDEVLERIKGIIREETGIGSLRVNIPRERLEKFFLDVVQKAQEEGITTAGVEMGGGAPEFISQTPKEPEKVIERLLKEEEAPPSKEPSEKEKEEERKEEEETQLREEKKKKLLEILTQEEEK